MKKFVVSLAMMAFFITSCKKEKDKVAPTAPVVTTAAVINITSTTASGGGNIVSNGGAAIIKCGLLWSTMNNTPTFTDSMVISTTVNGAFTSNMTGLEFNKTYYVRAFAINSIDTSFGSVVSFSTVNDTNKVRFTYNGKEVTYGIIISSVTGRKWLDRNLGAAQSATAYDDYKAYGDLFQWGRPADGHQLINWTSSVSATPLNGSSTILATSDIPGHSNFIIPPFAFPLDWRNDNNRNRWVTSAQGPCPAGWHVPTIAEWLAEVSKTKGGTAITGGMTDRNSGYNILKLTINAVRLVDGPGSVNFYSAGWTAGYYWSSTDRLNWDGYTDVDDFEVGGDYVQQMNFNKSSGLCVRCIKDN
jgi:uncharacterized protein (TIGR02145 family)